MPIDPTDPFILGTARTAATDFRERRAQDFAQQTFISGLSFPALPAIDPRTLSTVLEPVPVAQAQRVVGQSVAAGLVVAQGTPVSLFVTTRRSITGAVFVDAHPSFQAWTVDEINGAFLNVQAVKDALKQTAPLDATQRAAVTAALQGVTIRGTAVTVDETDSARSLDRALSTLRNASLFGAG